jgi:hypothetical protein
MDICIDEHDGGCTIWIGIGMDLIEYGEMYLGTLGRESNFAE